MWPLLSKRSVEQKWLRTVSERNRMNKMFCGSENKLKPTLTTSYNLLLKVPN